MTLQTDASFSRLGAVLTQGEEELESRALTEAEKKYSVTERTTGCLMGYQEVSPIFRRVPLYIVYRSLCPEMSK
jgi:hypothetical protein